jgi:DNA-binding HxlR family transcriptional regulator
MMMEMMINIIIKHTRFQEMDKRMRLEAKMDATFKIIGQKWTVLILREMFRDQTQFNRILEKIEGLTPWLFTQRMKALQGL